MNKDLVLLDLSSNQIDLLPENVFKDVEKLEELFLQMNSLKKLKAKVLRPLARLKCLRLDDNRLSELSLGIFDNQVLLRELNLRGNLLTFIPGKLFLHLHHLRILDLSDNKIYHVCNISSKFNQINSC